MENKRLANKILCLGVDGMDPRFAKRCIDRGLMPNVQKLLERGAANKDLIVLGGHPTITPPIWTTLACGCYANVHGITGFFRKGEDINQLVYNLDSRNCKAEQIWNVTAEAGLKTLVWHWPGSAWSPSSDSENLYVVDGSSPGCVGNAANKVDIQFLVGASTDIKEASFIKDAATDIVAPCVVDKIDFDDEDDTKKKVVTQGGSKIIMKENERQSCFSDTPLDIVRSPIRDAKGWSNAPENAKEFSILCSQGLLTYPCLILADENGKYTKVAVYKNKKAEAPLAVISVGEMVACVPGEAIINDSGKKTKVARNMRLLELDENAQKLTMYVSGALDLENDRVWHPKRIFHDILENVGPMIQSFMMGCQSKELISDCMLQNWYVNADWQSKSILYLIEKENLDVIFSHFHSVDLQGHMFFKHMNNYKGTNKLPEEDFIKFAEDIYVQADYYVGKFLHLLDEGWTILLFSDHGLVSSKCEQPFIGDTGGVNLRILQKYGITEVMRDEQGNELPEIDWTKTKACAIGECHIYLNLKGRNKHALADGTVIDGIVDPKDKYDVEEEIINALYDYRDPVTNRRVVSVAVHNRDAVHFGLGGPDSGDVIYFNSEGFNFDHGDCLSTTYGEAETSVSPIFIAAGAGIKENFKTDRIIREIDFAPTVAVLAGVRMPAQCEGAPVYQILTDK